MIPARSFCLIRHGETTANAGAIIAGATDVPLTPRGRDQARALAGREWPSGIALFASPMSRAHDTALLAFPGRDHQPEPDLRERDWGIFEGRPVADLPPREITPQGGEGWDDMLARVDRAIRRICATSGDALPVLVCHSGVIRAARVLWTSGDAGDRPPNATPILFSPDGTRFKEGTI